MSRYLQKLVGRAGGEPAAVVPLVPPPGAAERADLDPFEAVAEPAAGLAPPPPRQPALRTESIRPLPASASAYGRERFPPNPPEPRSEVIPPASVPPAQVEAPAVRPPRERAELRIAPPEETPPRSRPERTETETEAPAQRLEPRREQHLAPAADLVETVDLLRRRTQAEPEERRHSAEPPRESRHELEPPELRLLVPPSPVQAARKPPSEPETEPPRLVIGRLLVDVVPPQPPVREVVRVVSRAPSGGSRPAGTATKLRFGLGQM